MMHIQRLEMMAAFQNGTVVVTTGKRSGATTGDTSSITESYQGVHSEDRKRRDTKQTPKKLDYRNENRVQETGNEAAPNVEASMLSTRSVDKIAPHTLSTTNMEPSNSPMELQMMDMEESGASEGQKITNNKSSAIFNDAITVEANRHAELPTVATCFITESKPGSMPESGYSTPRRNND